MREQLTEQRDPKSRTLPPTLDPWIIAVLSLIPIIAYVRVLTYDFVNYDDPQYVFDNSMVRAGLTWRGITWALTTKDAANWHPLTWLSHMLDCQLFGLTPGLHHA